MNRRDFVMGVGVVLGSVALPGISEASPASTPTKPSACLISVLDPEAALAPCSGKKELRQTLLQEFRSKTEALFERNGLGWSDFYQAHVQLLREGQDWTNGVSDPLFPTAQLKTGRWELISRAIQLAYGQVRAPYKAAFNEKLRRGNTRFSNLPMNELLSARLNEEEARECGLLIPPHDEIRLLLRLRMNVPITP